VGIVELIKKYQDGEIEKHGFVRNAYEYHRIIEDYQALLESAGIERIVIDKENIVFEFSNNVKIYHSLADMYGIPLQFLNFGGYEKEELAVMRDLIEEGDVIFDIGAHVGWYGINLNRYYKNITLHSFEPMPANFRNLVNNFRLNGLDTSRAYNIGLFNENKTVEFYFDTENSKASSLTNLRGTDSVEKVTCEVRALDDFCEEKQLHHVDFIKCDVEGAELFVFRGAVKLIQRETPIVFTEMLRKWSAKFNYHPNDIIAFFSELGYLCFELVGEGLAPLPKVDETTVSTNYVFLHRSKHKEIISRLANK
jgi:FkbM family methyltransferase